MRAYCFEEYGFHGNPSLGMRTSILIQYRCKNQVKCQEITGIDGYITRMEALGDDLYLIENYYGCIAQGTHNHLVESVYKLTEEGLEPMTNAFETEDGLVSTIEIYWNECDYNEDERREKYECDESSYFSDVIYSRSLKELYIPKSCTRDGDVYLTESVAFSTSCPFLQEDNKYCCLWRMHEFTPQQLNLD